MQGKTLIQVIKSIFLETDAITWLELSSSSTGIVLWLKSAAHYLISSRCDFGRRCLELWNLINLAWSVTWFIRFIQLLLSYSKRHAQTNERLQENNHIVRHLVHSIGCQTSVVIDDIKFLGRCNDAFATCNQGTNEDSLYRVNSTACTKLGSSDYSLVKRRKKGEPVDTIHSSSMYTDLLLYW